MPPPVINGLVAVPIMAMMMLMGSQAHVMEDLRLPRRIQVLVLGWIATAVMLVAVVAMIHLDVRLMAGADRLGCSGRDGDLDRTRYESRTPDELRPERGSCARL